MQAKQRATVLGMGLVVAVVGACVDGASSAERQRDGVAPVETSGVSTVRDTRRSTSDLEALFPELQRTLKSEPQKRTLTDLRKLFPELDRTLTATEIAGN
jgi:hypothetical protein